jgi:hypothetical protein
MVVPAVVTGWTETDCTGSKVLPLVETAGCQPLAREVALVQGYIHVSTAALHEAPQHNAKWRCTSAKAVFVPFSILIYISF